METYEDLCKKLQRQTKKGQPELGMAMLQDFYWRNGLEPDCRYNQWMAHYKLIRLDINQKKGLIFNPLTDRNFLEAKEYFESPHEIPEGWEYAQEVFMEDLKRIELINEQLQSEDLTTCMGNNSKVGKFVSKLVSLLNTDENGAEKAEEEFYGKYDIAILTFIGILSTITILMVALRLVVQPPYWYLVDVFSIIMLITLTNSIVIRKIFKKK